MEVSRVLIIDLVKDGVQQESLVVDTHFYERLANWRRVYGDKPTYWRSPTHTAWAFFTRLRETEEEKYWRELNEIKARDPIQPAPDYADAELLQQAWRAMPERIDGVPVKHNIKVFVFGSARDYERLMRHAKVSPRDEAQWRRSLLQLFADEINRNNKG